jgi:hypothetical protein
MLVLAMEFSRGAQRAYRATGINQQTDAGVRQARARGRSATTRGGPASRRRVGIAPGCSKSRYQRSLPQNGIVMPVAIPRAHRPRGRDIEAMCGPPGAGWS